MDNKHLWCLTTAWVGLFSFLFLFPAAPGFCQETFSVEGQVLTDQGHSSRHHSPRTPGGSRWAGGSRPAH